MRVSFSQASALALSLALCACGRDTPPPAPKSQQQAEAPQVHSANPQRTESGGEKVPFNAIFQVNANGSVSPHMSVSVNGSTMAPGVSFRKGVLFGGLDLATMKDKTFLVERQGDLLFIKGVVQ